MGSYNAAPGQTIVTTRATMPEENDEFSHYISSTLEKEYFSIATSKSQAIMSWIRGALGQPVRPSAARTCRYGESFTPTVHIVVTSSGITSGNGSSGDKR